MNRDEDNKKKDKIGFTVGAELAESVLKGYTQLSGTFNVDQKNMDQLYHIFDNIKHIKQIVFNQNIHGDVYGNATQALGSEVNFSQQVTDAFKTAYNKVEQEEHIPNKQKEEIVKNLNIIEAKLQSKKDLDEIPSSSPMKWLRQNASWIVPTIMQVVMLGVKIALGTGIA